jgi:hypothetical protein
MRTTVVVLVVPALLAVGSGSCGPKSQLDPQSGVTLAGIIQSGSGGASASTPVKLIRHPDALQALGEVFVAVGSVGLACIAGRLDICSSFEDSTSGGDGSYRFALRGADTQGSVGQALTFTAFAGCPGGNCAVASDFFIQRPALTIPTLRFWTATGALATNGDGDVQPSWPAVEDSVGGAAADDYRVSLVAADGAVWWIQDAKSATTTTIDRRVTQDKAATWNVVAQRKQTGAGSGTDFTVDWYSTSQDYPSLAQTPISRGADCFTEGPDGMPAMLARPCPLTDGNPSTRFVPVSQSCTSGQTCPQINNWMIVDIGLSHPLGFLVLYDVSASNASANLLVETSDDLTAWTIQATMPVKPFQTATLNGAARFVRLRLSDPTAQWSAAANGEVAIYSPF